MEERPVLEEEELWRKTLQLDEGRLKEPVPDAAVVRLANQQLICGKSVVSLFLLTEQYFLLSDGAIIASVGERVKLICCQPA